MLMFPKTVWGGGACGLLGSQQSTQPAGPVASAAKASRTGTLQVA